VRRRCERIDSEGVGGDEGSGGRRLRAPSLAIGDVAESFRSHDRDSLIPIVEGCRRRAVARADWEEIAAFSATFDGYTHFGEPLGARFNEVRDRFAAIGDLPDDVDDLRACLFLESGATGSRGGGRDAQRACRLRRPAYRRQPRLREHVTNRYRRAACSVGCAIAMDDEHESVGRDAR
jgi:hypothetical protein